MKVLVKLDSTFRDHPVYIEVDTDRLDLEYEKAVADNIVSALSEGNSVVFTGLEPPPVSLDEVRLDWISKQIATPAARVTQLVHVHGEWRVEGSVYEGRGPTAREAIDAAMAEERHADRDPEDDDA